MLQSHRLPDGQGRHGLGPGDQLPLHPPLGKSTVGDEEEASPPPPLLDHDLSSPAASTAGAVAASAASRALASRAMTEIN
ncbi:hypothetical protein GUJ93_ZPchr0014g46523 [Zizania palustris]|uniref:Uncharacterized protein n=1 Tax=Zizania palustris TaxID=103762 RepID=A0A8J5TB77_ZIZPA|nr:hypothetical protein GUJ93_ZPchr0014g46523 [Zizania palustris]